MHGCELREEERTQQPAERRVAEGLLHVRCEGIELSEERDCVGEVSVEQELKVRQERIEDG